MSFDRDGKLNINSVLLTMKAGLMRNASCMAVALVLVMFSIASVSAGLIDITRPGDPIELVNGFNQGPDTNVGPPPAGEVVTHAIDDVGQKYLNFLDLSSGFKVTPSANLTNSPVTALRLYTANDAEERDPASFQLLGSNTDLNGPWTAIASGNLALPAGRNAAGNAVVIPPTGNPAALYQEVSFTNALPYNHYQIVFPTLKDAAAANSMQIAEVEFLVVPEPASLALLGLGGLALLAARKRSK